LYGLITIFVGGSFTQLLFYAYSVATLFAFLWALKIVKAVSRMFELPKNALRRVYHVGGMGVGWSSRGAI
jgi:hypothetical protein